MTREEAIAILIREIDDDPFMRTEYREQIHEAFNIAIKALEQEPCEDAISRQAVLDKLNEWEWQELYLPIHFKENIIDELPSVTPAERTGHWVEIDDEPHEVWECDNCGFVIDGSGCVDAYDYRDTYKFCPNCGAKMFEPQESEDKRV